MTEPINIPVCVLCERKGRPLDPFMMLLVEMPDGRWANVRMHMACLVTSIAGETAETVGELLQTGQIEIGLRKEGDDFADTVAAITERLIHKYM